MSIIGTPLSLWFIWKNSDLFLRHQIQLSARTIDNIQIGSNRNINFACQYSRYIDDVQQVFDVTQACFQITAVFTHCGSLIHHVGDSFGDTNILFCHQEANFESSIRIFSVLKLKMVHCIMILHLQFLKIKKSELWQLLQNMTLTAFLQG